MTSDNKYATSSGMRMALEERLNKISRDEGVDILKLRRHVSFDRLLARLYTKAPDNIIVKGGYALELRLDYARTTKDVDISFKGNLNGYWSNDGDRLQEFLQDCADIDLSDYFDYVIGSASLDLENALYGGFRFPIDARMDGRTFSKFNIDMAAGDTWIEPHELISPKNWMEFAGIESPTISLISIEQQFSEKLHAFTLPRERPNSRVKDIVDILALIRTGQLNIEKLKISLKETFKVRNTHNLPTKLPTLPDNWAAPFNKMVKECKMNMRIDTALEEIGMFCEKYGLYSLKE